MRTLIAPLLLIFFAVGCTSVPETPREKLVAAEVTYEAAINTTNDLISQGVIVPGSDLAETASTLILSSRTALDAWQEVPDNGDRQQTALVTLQALQLMLNKLQEREQLE